MLHIDTREPKSLITAVQAAVGPKDTNLVLLDSADYLVFDRAGNGVAVERKTITDFLASLRGRLHDQVGRMDAVYPTRILLLEGTADRTTSGKVAVGRHVTGWSYAAYQMQLLALQRHHQFLILPTAGRPETVATLKALHSYCLARRVPSD